MRRVSGRILVTQHYDEKNNIVYGEINPRVSWCGFRNLYGKNTGVSLVQGVETGRVFYSGLMHCGSVWRCPVCSFKIARQRQLEVYDILQHYHKEGRRMSFITLTVAHKKQHTLQSSLDLLLSEFRKMQRLKPYKKVRESYVGMIKSLEITYGDNGWHPHLHILLIHNEDVNRMQREFVARELLRLWFERKEIQKRGTLLKHQKQYEVYTTKQIGDYVTKWDVSGEMTKSFSKEPRMYITKDGEKKRLVKGVTPFGLLAFVWSRQLKLEDIYIYFEEYVIATKGRANVIISNGVLSEMKKKYPNWRQKTDEEVLRDEFIDKVLFKIDKYLWYKLFTSNKIIDLQFAYERKGMEGVYSFLSSYNYEEKVVAYKLDGVYAEVKSFELKNVVE